MARASDEIFNPRTGQRMMFLETGEETSGQSLRIDTYNPPTGVPEPEHVHPFQESGFQVISGSLRFRVIQNPAVYFETWTRNEIQSYRSPAG